MLEVEIVGARRDRRKVQALARFIRELRSLRLDRLWEAFSNAETVLWDWQLSMTKLVIGKCSFNLGTLYSQSGIDLSIVDGIE